MNNLNANSNSNCQPGCVRLKSGKFMPIVMEAHGAVYFSGNTTTSPSVAITLAEANIVEDSFRSWHNHKLSQETKD